MIPLTVVLVSALILGGCAKPAPEVPPPEEEVAPPPAPPEEEEVAPPEEEVAPAPGKYGGIFKVAINIPVGVFGDPMEMRGPDRLLANGCLQKLIFPAEALAEYEPVLVKSWELAPDGSYYILHLRKGVKFHDGTPFNAEAVKWNMNRVIAAAQALKAAVKGAAPKEGPPPPEGAPPKEGPPPGPPGGEIGLTMLESVDVIDDYTVRFNLSNWSHLVLFELSIPCSCFMISPTSFEKNGAEWAATHPVGTGPFKFKDYKRSVYSKYERFDDYWEEGLPYLDGFEVILMADPMTAVASLKAGEIDAISQIDIPTAQELLAEGYYDIPRGPEFGRSIIPNTTDPNSVWYDKRMREALEYAIDKEKITRTLLAGIQQPSYGLLPGCPGSPATVPRKYDPDKARQLMAEAGYPEGVKSTLFFNVETFRDPILALQANLAEVGIDLELEPLARPTMEQFRITGVSGNDLRLGEMPGGAVLFGPSQDLFIQTVFNPDIKRPEGSKELMEAILVERDNQKMVAMWEQLEEASYGEDLIQIPLWTDPMVSAFNPKFHDYEAFSRAGPDITLTRAWFSK